MGAGRDRAGKGRMGVWGGEGGEGWGKKRDQQKIDQGWKRPRCNSRRALCPRPRLTGWRSKTRQQKIEVISPLPLSHPPSSTPPPHHHHPFLSLHISPFLTSPPHPTPTPPLPPPDPLLSPFYPLPSFQKWLLSSSLLFTTENWSQFQAQPIFLPLLSPTSTPLPNHVYFLLVFFCFVKKWVLGVRLKLFDLFRHIDDSKERLFIIT